MMTIRAAKFTPEVLLSAPRRSAGSPDPTGKRVLYTVSEIALPAFLHVSHARNQSFKGGDSLIAWQLTTLVCELQTSSYSFDEHKKTLQLQLLDLDTGRSTLLYRDSNYSEPTWVSDSKFIFIKSGEKGSSSLMVADANNPGAPLVFRLALTIILPVSCCAAMVRPR